MSKVLIVEDETILSTVYDMVLTMSGFTTKVAHDGQDALEVVASFKPDIILLDLLMPRVDGIRFLKAFKPEKHPNVQVIVYSNLFDSRKEEEVKALGATEIVLKSNVTPQGLVELVSSYLAPA